MANTVEPLKFKSKILILVFIFYLLNFFGCATVPPREEYLQTYNINGATYIALVSLCQERQIAWDYDTFSKTVVLTKAEHKISLRVGDALALVDGRAEYLHQPVDLYQGTIVVPLKFKERIIDVLFKERFVSTKERFVFSNIRKVVVDAGHGGNDPGTIGRSGLREKNVNLDVAKRLAKILKDNGVEVIMTRTNDVFVSLARRSAIANNAKADLFISIHSNANRVRSLNGFEIYYLSPKVSDLRRAVSSSENSRFNFDNNYLLYSNQNLKAILWDMIHTYNRGESIRLARNICNIVDRDLDTRVIGVKSAGFQVLKGANMPAILIEIGFLSNYNEERLIKNGYYRQQIAEAIGRGIEKYTKDFIYAEASY